MRLINIKSKLTEYSAVILSVISLIMGLMGLYHAQHRDFGWVIPLFTTWTLIKIFNDRVPNHLFKARETSLEFIIETINEISVVGVILPFTVFIYLKSTPYTPLFFSCIFFTLCSMYREIDLLLKQLNTRTELIMGKYFLGFTCPINSGFYVAPLFFEAYGVPIYFPLENVVTAMLIFGGLSAIVPIPTYSLAIVTLNKGTTGFLSAWLGMIFILAYSNPAYAWILFLGVVVLSVPISVFNYQYDLKQVLQKEKKKDKI